MNNIFKKYFSKQEEDLEQYLENFGGTNWESTSIQAAPITTPNTVASAPIIYPSSTSRPIINPAGYGTAASAPMSYPDPDCDDGDEVSSSGSPYARLKAELKQEIVTEVFEEIFKQLVDVEIISQKEMKEKLKRIMDRMGY